MSLTIDPASPARIATMNWLDNDSRAKMTSRTVRTAMENSLPSDALPVPNQSQVSSRSAMYYIRFPFECTQEISATWRFSQTYSAS